MEKKKLNIIRLKNLAKLFLFCFLLIGCKSAITEYGYIENAPYITINENEAKTGYPITTKLINDTVYYVYSAKPILYTYSLNVAKNKYIVRATNVKIDNSSLLAEFEMDGTSDTIYERYYTKDHKDVKSILYYGEKKIKSFTTYHNGNPQNSKSFYINGNINENINWDYETSFRSVRKGVYEKYYENGNIFISGFYKNGVRSGVWLYYDESGVVIKTEEWIKGRHILENGDTVRVLLGEKLDTIPCAK